METEIRERGRKTVSEAAEPARALAAFFTRQAQELGANNYLLLNASGGITSCNWVYDAVAELGLPAIGQLAECAAVIWPGNEMRGYHPLALAALTEKDEIGALAHHGHQEIFILALPGRAPSRLFLSAGKPGRIDKAALRRAQIMSCYALSRFMPANETQCENPLSEKEIDCLSWVSHGKTTDEVALILNISTNSVNSQIAHAIQKLEAKNRAMAIATAIRRNLI